MAGDQQLLPMWTLGGQRNLRSMRLQIYRRSPPIPLVLSSHPRALRQPLWVSAYLRHPLWLKPGRCSTIFQQGKKFLFLPFLSQLFSGIATASATHYFYLNFADEECTCAGIFLCPSCLLGSSMGREPQKECLNSAHQHLSLCRLSPNRCVAPCPRWVFATNWIWYVGRLDPCSLPSWQSSYS